MKYLIVMDEPTSLRHKRVLAYLENGGVYRQMEMLLAISEDADVYIAENFAGIWAEASALDSAVWMAAEERDYRDLHKAIVRAGIVAARGQGAGLADVSNAMEAVILASGKSGAYNKLLTMVGAATATERNRFFAIAVFVLLGDVAAD